ncbi:hypothetical protein NL676_023638 [Syzygium grande]|nr:hypothetical protein NL676_023638 [Syzygium grande]
MREEDLSPTTAAMAGLNLSAVNDDEDDHPVLSAAAVAAASRNKLCPPSLQTLLEYLPDSAAFPHNSSSGGIRDIDSQKSWLQEVIVGAHAVMANGGVTAPAGLNVVALAAQGHAVPFVVVAGSHKRLHNASGLGK